MKTLTDSFNDTIDYGMRDILICAPTGTGKTHLVIDKLKNFKYKILILCPTHVLCNQWTSKFNQVGINVSPSDNPDFNAYRKFITVYENSIKYVTGIKTDEYIIVVIDECHFMHDTQRRFHLMILYTFRNYFNIKRFILLSATPDLDFFSRMGILILKCDETTYKIEDIPLDNRTNFTNLIEATYFEFCKTDKKVLVFFSSIVEMKKAAIELFKLVQHHEYISPLMITESFNDRIEDISLAILHLYSIYLHWSYCSNKYSLFVEKKMTSNEFMMIFCTTTLVAGIDANNVQVVISSPNMLKKVSSEIIFHQMRGRTGRHCDGVFIYFPVNVDTKTKRSSITNPWILKSIIEIDQLNTGFRILRNIYEIHIDCSIVNITYIQNIVRWICLGKVVSLDSLKLISLVILLSSHLVELRYDPIIDNQLTKNYLKKNFEPWFQNRIINLFFENVKRIRTFVIIQTLYYFQYKVTFKLPPYLQYRINCEVNDIFKYILESNLNVDIVKMVHTCYPQNKLMDKAIRSELKLINDHIKLTT